MKIKVIITIKYQVRLEIFKLTIKGNNRVISTSKIKKIIAIKKKCNEKGRRADDFGSKPHSKGDLFSRSIKDFFETKFTIIININIKNLRKIEIEIKIIIIYTINRSFDWKSNIIFILYKYLPHQ
jgi:hypothetical protein